MNKVARLSAGERRDLFAETGARRGMNPAIAEKDFWVCWVLRRLFADPELRGRMVFKGGTTLSKVYGLIDRFSEDIDLVLDWRLLGYAETLGAEPATATQRDKYNKAMNAKAAAYIAGPLMERLVGVLDGVGVAVDAEDPHTVNVAYPAAFREGYLRPEVRLEIGPLASWVPSAEREIRPYAADQFPGLFADPVCAVVAIDAGRTFWEKATILHQQAHRPGPAPERYSRHYYDLYKLAASDLGRYAARDFGMLADVVAFKQRFYPARWASYETAVPGTLRLLPREDQMAELRRDYAAMGVMIFGETVAFSEIVRGLQELERAVNLNPAMRA
jgi:hypothetical protein